MIAPSADEVRKDLEFARDSHLQWAEHLEAHAAPGEQCEQCDSRPYKLDAAYEREWVAKYDAALDLLASQSRALEEAQREIEKLSEENQRLECEVIAETTRSAKAEAQLTAAQGEIARLDMALIEARHEASCRAGERNRERQARELSEEFLEGKIVKIMKKLTDVKLRAEQAEAARERLSGLSTKWREEVKVRGGQGCGCYGRSTQLRICADELDAALATPVRPTEAVTINPSDEDGDVVVQLQGVPNWHLVAHGATRGEALTRLAELVVMAERPSEDPQG